MWSEGVRSLQGDGLSKDFGEEEPGMVQEGVVEGKRSHFGWNAKMGKGYQTGLQRCPGADQEGPNQPR